ncbi:MAG: NDP-sugar synthase [Clostridia bacterium]|nr:NDP-sugar synthase [Clostridia bacterium]
MENGFECVILAGGKGERLRPVTQTRPKPLCKVAGVSCLERCVRAARAAGAAKITVSACYMAAEVEKECARLGVSCVADEKPLGTAGACRECAGGDRHVLVLSGDGWFDFDLKNAAESHFERSSDCTVALTECDSPTSYGCAVVKDGVITRFVEKPSWSHVCGSEVNTGIYLLSPRALALIPPGVQYDFASDLFPALFDCGVPIHAYKAEGFWCDIGDAEAYLECCMHVTGGRNDISPEAKIAKSAKITRSVIMENAFIGAGTVIDGAVICENCRIGKNCLVPPGCVLGGGCAVGDGTALERGVRLGAGSITEPDSYIKKDVKTGVAKGKLFDTDDGAGGAYGGSFSPSVSLDAGAACACAAKRIGVMWAEDARSELMARSFACGARFGGASVVSLGPGCEGLAAFCSREYSLDICAFFEYTGPEVRLVLRGRGGALVAGATKSKIERAFRAGTPRESAPGGEETPYGSFSPVCRFSALLAHLCGDLTGVKVNLPSFNQTSSLFKTVCVSAGAKVAQSAPAALSFRLDGLGIMLTTRDGRTFSGWQISAYVLAHSAEDIVMLPEGAPRSAADFISAFGKKVVTDGKNLPVTVVCAAAAGAELLALCASQGRDLADIANDFPVFTVRTETLDFPARRKAAFTGELCREFGCDEPVYTDKRGTVRFIPDSPRGFRIVAEAASGEFADELCEFARRRVSSPPRVQDP